MIKQLLIVLVLLTTLEGFAQVVAYPVELGRIFGSSCVDLNKATHIVIGHQTNITISYYATLVDAQNEMNSLSRFYEPMSNPEIIIARVDSNSNSDYATSEINISWSTSSPPPPLGLCVYDVCDTDNNGSEIIYLNNLTCHYGLGFPDESFCNSLENEVQTTFYLTENDAITEVNSINPIYTISNSQRIYHKIKNTTSKFSKGTSPLPSIIFI